jgi:hypothetical protein
VIGKNGLLKPRYGVVLWLFVACLGGAEAVLALHGDESRRFVGVGLGALQALLGLANAIIWIRRT